jgi:chemotaxis protein histidine kinase CheA
MAQETVRVGLVQELALVQRMAPTSLPLYLQRLPAETAAAEAAAAEKAAAEAAAAAEKAAADKAAAEQVAAERAAAEQAAAEKAAAERAAPKEWWQPLDWMVLVKPPTAAPAGDDGKTETEKSEATEAAARPPAPHREYNLGGYVAPPPAHSKADLEANLDSAAIEVPVRSENGVSARYKARLPPSTSPRMHVITTPEPWLGGSVSTERLERMVSRRGGRRALLSRRAGEEAQPDTKALAEPSHRSAVTSALGWSPSSWLR